MTLQPLLDAPITVQAHAAAVACGFLAGVWTVVDVIRRSDIKHRLAAGGLLFGALVVIGAINVLLLRGTIHDEAFSAPSARPHAVLVQLVTIDYGAARR